MVITGFVPLTMESGKTSIAIGFVDALSSIGNNVLFLNFNFFYNESNLLTSYCDGTFTKYINKKKKLSDIITRVHSTNFDLINISKTDYDWLMTMDKHSLSTLISNFIKSISNLKKYDVLFINFFSSTINDLNQVLVNHTNSLYFITNPAFVEKQNITLVLKYIGISNIKKTNFFILFNKFIKLSKQANEIIEQFKLTFPSFLIEYHIPIMDELLKLNNLSINKNEFFMNSLYKLRPLFLEIIKSLNFK